MAIPSGRPEPPTFANSTMRDSALMEDIRPGSPRLILFGHRSMPWLVPVLLVLGLVLSGCSIGGGNDEAAPTTTALAVQGTAGGTVAPRLVGELADRINASWSSVRSYRATTVQGSGDLALVPLPTTPDAAAPPADPNATWEAVVDEIVLPDQRHYLESSGGAISEFSAIGGRVYARGRFTQIAIRPDLDATTWVNLDPAFISPDSTIGGFLSAFSGGDAAAYRAPLADLQPDTRERELTAAGTIDVGGRSCAAYRWVDTSDTGDPMTRMVSIDSSGLPCSLEFTAGDYSGRTTWDMYSQVPAIVAPVESVTVGQTLDMGTASGMPGADVDGAAATPAVPNAAGTPDSAATPAVVATPLAG